MTSDRELQLEGCFNARDLGGIATRDGSHIRRGALVRSDALDRLTPHDWSKLHDHGIRTIIDLRKDWEVGPDESPGPPDIMTIRIDLDGDDREFWSYWGDGPRFATPMYYRPHLNQFPERSGQVIKAIATARPGGVLYHCVSGRDRTGMITMLLLALIDVPPEDIADDYGISETNSRALMAGLGREHEIHIVAKFLADSGTTARQLVLEVLGDLDVEAQLRKGGVTGDEIAAVRDRMLDPT